MHLIFLLPVMLLQRIVMITLASILLKSLYKARNKLAVLDKDVRAIINLKFEGCGDPYVKLNS